MNVVEMWSIQQKIRVERLIHQRFTRIEITLPS
jgi:hypothetical protein